MRKGLSILAVFSCLVLHAAGEPDAVVESYEGVFTMTSATSGSYHVRTTILVNNEDGLKTGAFVVTTDSFRSLSSFSGTLQRGGKPVKIKSSELVKLASMSGLADDITMHLYEPSGSYPLRISYEYTVTYKKGLLAFPSFFPVTAPAVTVDQASFTLNLPRGTAISYASNGLEMKDLSSGDRDIRTWEVKNFEGIVEEHGMPSVMEIAPYLFSCPVEFEFGGYPGNQKDWNSFGAWIASLSDGSDVLPEAVVAKVREMTAGCTSDFEKTKVLYDYLRQTTRYVNISLGIGGLKPIEASRVAARGFGDCKALSNYLMALLKAADVPSVYYIINTSRKDLLPGHVASQFNHAMLAVPLKEYGDTLWVECTNPRIPLGYRHSDAAGHEVILIEKDGGKRVRIPAYPDSLSGTERIIDVDLAPTGAASVALEQRVFLDDAEPWIDFRDWKADEQVRALSRGIKFHPEDFKIVRTQDNFGDYARYGKSYCPQFSVGATLKTHVYANRSGDTRLFVPLNPFSQGIYSQRSARVNEIVFREPVAARDTIRIRIPEGFSVESLPEPVDIEDSWGRFHSSATVEDGTVTIVQTLSIVPCRREASAYADFRAFARGVNKAYESSFVLVKK